MYSDKVQLDRDNQFGFEFFMIQDFLFIFIFLKYELFNKFHSEYMLLM